MVRARTWLGAFGLCLSSGYAGTASAQDVPVQADQPDDAVPPEIPTIAFASDSSLSGAKLSPDGHLLAYSMRRDGSTYIVTHDADTRA